MVWLQKIGNVLSFGQKFVSGFVVMCITLLSIGYASAGLMILFNRELNEPLSGQEVTLILAFAGVQGFVYSVYNNRRD